VDQDALSFVMAWFGEHHLVEFLKKPLTDIHGVFCNSVYFDKCANNVYHCM